MTSKKRSPKEIIEAREDDLTDEEVYVKFPGQELTSVRLKNVGLGNVRSNLKEIRRLSKSLGRKTYTIAHTHPHICQPKHYQEDKDYQEAIKSWAIPSSRDITTFLADDSMKTMVVVPQNRVTAKIGGYFILRKTKKTKPLGFRRLGLHFPSIKGLLNVRKLGLYLEARDTDRDLKEIADKYSLKYRYISADKEKPAQTLENSLALKASFAFLISIFFLSSNITGNVISNLSIKTSNIIGVILFLVGLVGAFLYLRGK